MNTPTKQRLMLRWKMTTRVLSAEVTVQAAHAPCLTTSGGFFRTTGVLTELLIAVLNFGRAHQWQCNAGHVNCTPAEDKEGYGFAYIL